MAKDWNSLYRVRERVGEIENDAMNEWPLKIFTIGRCVYTPSPKLEEGRGEG